MSDENNLDLLEGEIRALEKQLNELRDKYTQTKESLRKGSKTFKISYKLEFLLNEDEIWDLEDLPLNATADDVLDYIGGDAFFGFLGQFWGTLDPVTDELSVKEVKKRK